MKIWRKCVLFYLGGCLYVGVELLWRQRSHPVMFLAGGLCFVLLGGLGKLPAPARALAATAVITAVELTVGLLWNRNYAIWDYRGQPGNLWGQICPLYCLLWIPLGMTGAKLYRSVAARLP